MSQEPSSGYMLLGFLVGDLMKGEAKGDLTDEERKDLKCFRALQKFLYFNFGPQLPDSDADMGLIYLVCNQKGGSTPYTYARTAPGDIRRVCQS